MVPPALTTACVVFSKDRALQLDAALRSLAETCFDGEALRTSVLFLATTDIDRRQYEELSTAHPTVRFVAQGDFRTDLLALLDDTPFVLFVVDDTLFTAPWSLARVRDGLMTDERLIGVSLRLGTNTTWCYSLNRAQAVPEMLPLDDDLVAFDHADGSGDFGYPLEVSSSVYRTEDIRQILATAKFDNPNQLEVALDRDSGALRQRRPLLASFTQSVAFSNPINVVQNEFLNRHADEIGWSKWQLRRLFDAGLRIDVASYQGLVTCGCHEEQPIRFLHPDIRRTSVKLDLSIETTGRAGQHTNVTSRGAEEWWAPEHFSQDDFNILYALSLLNRLASDPAGNWLKRFISIHDEILASLENELKINAKDYRKYITAQRAEARTEIDKIKRILIAASVELNQRRQLAEETAQAKKALEQQLDELYHSRSWRITRPLRGVSRLVGFLAGKLSLRMRAPVVLPAISVARATTGGETPVGLGPSLAAARDVSRQPILAIVPYLPVGGAESLLYRVISGLAKDYEFIIVTTLSDKHAWHDRFLGVVSRIYHLPDLLPQSQWDDFLLRTLTEEGIRRVLTSGSLYGYDFLPKLKLLAPEIQTYALLHNDEWQGHRANALRVLPSIDHLIAISDRIAATLFHLDSVAASRIRTIRNGIDSERSFFPGAISREDARGQFGLPADRVVIGFVGRLSSEKNPAAFLDLIESCRSLPNVAFAIFGEGSLDELVEARLSALGDTVRVQWLRSITPEQMPAVYAAIDLLVITSTSEGLPLVLLEAMGMAVPAVAYDVGDIAAVLADDVTGHLVAAGDFVTLVKQVGYLAENPSQRIEQGKAARARLIELGLTEARMVAEYRALFSEAVPNGPEGGRANGGA